MLTSAQTGRCFCNSILFIQMLRAFVLGLVCLTSVKLGSLSVAVHKEHPLSVVYVFHKKCCLFLGFSCADQSGVDAFCTCTGVYTFVG